MNIQMLTCKDLAICLCLPFLFHSLDSFNGSLCHFENVTGYVRKLLGCVVSPEQCLQWLFRNHDKCRVDLTVNDCKVLENVTDISYVNWATQVI